MSGQQDVSEEEAVLVRYYDVAVELVVSILPYLTRRFRILGVRLERYVSVSASVRRLYFGLKLCRVSDFLIYSWMVCMNLCLVLLFLSRTKSFYCLILIVLISFTDSEELDSSEITGLRESASALTFNFPDL